MAVVATAGTTNTGTIDPLPEITAIARRAGVHCHVDAAYGGALLFSSRYRDRLDGIEAADSVTVDPHKWLFQPFSLGGLFVRDGRALNASFRTEPDYLRKDLESEPERLDFYHYSMEGSRPFRGLKFWFTLKGLGRRGLGALVDRTMQIAFHLERRGERLLPLPSGMGAPLDPRRAEPARPPGAAQPAAEVDPAGDRASRLRLVPDHRAARRGPLPLRRLQLPDDREGRRCRPRPHR